MKTISSHAAAAKLIRKDLAKAFPSVKFSVRSESFSMGDAVRIEWLDGPIYSTVDELVKKYQYGHFNGMEDMYENSNTIEGLPQVKFVTTSRRMSEATKEAIKTELGEAVDQYDHENLVYRTFAQRELA